MMPKDVQSGSYDFRAPAGVPKGDSTNPGKLKRIEIELAENGYEVECRHEAPKSKEKNPAPVDYDSLTKQYVFKTAKETAAFIAEKLA